MEFVDREDARIGFHDDPARAGQDAPVVVLITGLAGAATEWGEPFLDAMRHRARLIRVENRGVGASENRAEAFGMADMAADVVAVLDALELSSAHILGLSMGGMVAQQVALDSPTRAASLVLLSTHFGGAEVVPMTARAQVMFEPQPAGQSQARYYERLFTQLTAPGFGERNLAQARAFIEARLENPIPLATYHSQLHALLESDRSEAVRALRQPTLVLHGAEDPLIPVANARMLADRIPHAELEVLPDCGHMPPWELPAETASRILSFLDASTRS